MYLGFFNGTDSAMKEGGGNKFYQTKKTFPATSSHYQQSWKIVGSSPQVKETATKTSYQQFYQSASNVAQQPTPVLETVSGQKRDKYQGKTVHARDHRRLEVLSPTYLKTHLKIVDNMLEPSVPMLYKTAFSPKVVYNTKEKREMD